jgi:hypothetical protein
MIFREFESHVFGEDAFSFGVDVLEGNIESGHDSGFVLGVSHEVVLVVVELEVDQLVDSLPEVVSEIVELPKRMGISLEFPTLDFGRDVVNIVFSLVIVDSN